MSSDDLHDLHDRIIAALRRITRAIDLRSRALVQGFGLTAPQLATLKAILELQPVSAGRIAREVHLSPPTISGILTRLERAGLITRTPDERDRRAVVCKLTDAGTRALNAAPSLLQDEFRVELSKLHEWEQSMMLATLQRIGDMMQASGLDSAPILTAEADLAHSIGTEENSLPPSETAQPVSPHVEEPPVAF